MTDLIYEVSFKGVASPTLRAAFMDCELTAATGVTSVRCTKASVRPVIARIEEFGLELVAVRMIAEHRADRDSPPEH